MKLFFKGLIFSVASISMMLGLLSACGVKQPTNNNQSSDQKQESPSNKQSKSQSNHQLKQGANTNPDPIERYLIFTSSKMQMHHFDGADSVWIDGDWHIKSKHLFGPKYVYTNYEEKKKKPAIAIYNMNWESSKKYQQLFICPRAIGHMAINNIAKKGQNKEKMLHFITTSGVTGTFSLQTHKWTFSSTKKQSTFVNIDPIHPLNHIFKVKNEWIDGDWHNNKGGFGGRYIYVINKNTGDNPPSIGVDYMHKGKQNNYFMFREGLLKTYKCPRQIGQITITSITDNGNSVHFTYGSDNQGTWNLKSHKWRLD